MTKVTGPADKNMAAQTDATSSPGRPVDNNGYL